MTKVFRLKISLRGARCDDFPASYCTRTIDILDNESLESLAETILDSYDFAMDHAFGFYSNLNDYYDSEEVYTLFADLEESEDESLNGKSVQHTNLHDVFEKNKTMLFVFDYGDEWIFHVRCTSVDDIKNDRDYPSIIESKGKAPEQYPGFNMENDAA